MKTTSSLFLAAGVATLGLLAALAGCANAPTRLTTVEATATPAFARADGNLEAPVPLRTVRPQYPFEMKRSGIGGDVHVKCLIDEKGFVRESEVVTASQREFEQPALAAIKQWTFQPARRDGVPTAQWVVIPLKFTFTED